MAYSTRRSNANSILIARQSDATTENTTDGDFAALPAEFEITHGQDQEDLQLAAGQYGASEPPAPGRRFATVTLRGAIEGLVSTYDYTSNAIDGSGIASPIIALLGNVLGSAGASAVSSSAEFLRIYHLTRTAYHNGSVNAGGSTTTVVNVDDQSYYTAGALAGWVTDASDQSPSIGWAKTLTNDTQDLVTLFEAMAAAPANADDQIPTATAYLSSNAPAPLTIRRLGDNAAWKWSYTGWIADSLKLTMTAGKTAKWEASGQALARTRYSTGGGLIAPTNYKRTKAYNANNGGRFLVDGTAVCGWHEVELSIKWDLTQIECPNKAEGVTEPARLLSAENPITVTATVPVQSSDSVTGGKDVWEAAYESGTAYSISGYVGTRTGAIFSWLCPQMALAMPPEFVDFNGLDAYKLTFRPSAYSSDDGSTAPADTLVRFGWA